jgi:hypothetical protein
MSNTFKVAGVSKQNGEIKVRFANDMLRVKVLEKNGHTGIDLMELPREMEKDAIPAYLLSIDFDNGNKEIRAAIESARDARMGNKDAPKKEVKKPKKPKSTPSLDAIAARAKLTKTPQVPALPGTAPLGIAVDPSLEDAPY